MPVIKGGFKIEKGKVVKGLDQLMEFIPIKEKKRKKTEVPSIGRCRSCLLD